MRVGVKGIMQQVDDRVVCPSAHVNRYLA